MAKERGGKAQRDRKGRMLKQHRGSWKRKTRDKGERVGSLLGEDRGKNTK